jgi:DNA-binding transcriptional ArsR family regulator
MLALQPLETVQPGTGTQRQAAMVLPRMHRALRASTLGAARMSKLFVHSTIDDAGLSMKAFRLLCHLARCGNFKSSFARITKTCKISHNSISTALEELRQAGFLTIEREHGKPNAYRLTIEIGAATSANEGQVNEATSANEGQHQRKRGTATSANEGHISNPLSNPLGNMRDAHAQSASEKAEELYQLFPRKLDKKRATSAIKAALKKADFETLKKAVLVYAEERRGKELQFTKYPATWFNGESWKNEADTSATPTGKFKTCSEGRD